jgi:hypothetical protein
MRPPATLLFILGLATSVGALSMAAPSALGADQNPYLEGLVKVEGSRVTLAYQRPGTRWEIYKTIQIVPLDVQVAVNDRALVQQMYAEEIRAEMAKQNFAVVDTPRADTLIIQARLLQVVAGSLSIRMAFSDGTTKTIVGALSDMESAKGLITDRESKIEEARGAFRNWGRILAGHLKEMADSADVDPEECFKWQRNCD